MYDYVEINKVNQRSKYMDFPGVLVLKNPPTNAGDTGLISGSGRSPGEGNGNSLQYICLGNPVDRGAGYSHGIAKESDMTSPLNNKKEIYVSANK